VLNVFQKIKAPYGNDRMESQTANRRSRIPKTNIKDQAKLQSVLQFVDKLGDDTNINQYNWR
jgi:hypothetical protein